MDSDSNVNIDDVTSLITYLLTNNASQINVANADVDGDGTITISDVTALIGILLH